MDQAYEYYSWETEVLRFQQPIRKFSLSKGKLKKQKSRIFLANVRKKGKIYSIVFTLGGAKKLGQMGLIDFSFFRLIKA